jgi:type IV secretory pathway TraG/TraD family ATPase VirD4
MSKESKQRKYFVLDEFDSIGKVSSVRDTLLSKGRKYGATALIAVQTLSQMRERYGREGAAAILGNCGTWISFRTTDVEMSEEISKRIGEAEIERVTTNKNVNRTRGKNGTASEGQTQQTQVVKKRLVMPEELRALASCEGFLMTCEGRVCPIHLDYPPARSARARSFIRKAGAGKIEETASENEAGFE